MRPLLPLQLAEWQRLSNSGPPPVVAQVATHTPQALAAVFQSYHSLGDAHHSQSYEPAAPKRGNTSEEAGWATRSFGGMKRLPCVLRLCTTVAGAVAPALALGIGTISLIAGSRRL